VAVIRLIADDLNHPDHMEHLAWALHRRGYADQAAEQVVGANFVRHFAELCG
jgi:microsomal dipeptidase-like Zn-dependent dipeptidase